MYVYGCVCVCVCVIQINFFLWKAVNMEVIDSTKNRDATVSRVGSLEGPLC